MKRGEIYWAELSPTLGSEISKLRPVLIVSNDINNEYAATITILPITSKTERIYLFEVLLKQGEGNLQNDSKIKANQIRTIDKMRVREYIGRLFESKMKEVERAIIVHLSIGLL